MSYVSVNVSRQGYSSYRQQAWRETNSYIGYTGTSVDMTCFTLVPQSNATSLTVSFTMRNVSGSYSVKYKTTMPSSGWDSGTTRSISASGNSITISGTFYAGQSYTVYVWGDVSVTPVTGSYECSGASASGEYDPPTPPDDGSLARVHHGGSFVQYEAKVHHSGAWASYEPYVFMSGQWRKMG